MHFYLEILNKIGIFAEKLAFIIKNSIMLYKEDIQVTENGLLYVIHKVELFTEDGFIASLYVRNLSEIDILLKIADVRECLSIAHREFLSLSKFSLTFNSRWATEDNKRFSSTQIMLNKLRSSLASIKRSYRESCPIVRKQQPQGEMFRDRLSPSVFERSVLTNGGCARDLFGIESYSDNIQTLYVEQRALFANVLASLMLCYKEIEKEKLTKADPDKCVELLEKQCRDIMKELNSTIDLIQRPVTDEIQRFIDEMGLREFAQKGYHEHTIEEVRNHAISIYKQGAKSNIAQTASLLWVKNPAKGNDVQLLIEHFDEFRSENRKKVSSDKILFFVNWCNDSIDAPQKQFYDFLKTYYRNKELVDWHSVTCRKNNIKNLVEEQQKFNEEVKIFLDNLQKAA